MKKSLLALCFFTLAAVAAPLEPMDVFQLEWVSDPQVSPDGKQVAYVRNFMDVMADRRRSNLWVVDLETRRHRPLTTGMSNDRSPRWSPSGEQLAYVTSREGGSEIWLRWMDGGEEARLTQLDGAPNSVTWSRDGKWLAFAMSIDAPPEPLASMPARPDGANWAPGVHVVERLVYRFDGAGYVDPQFSHVFLLSTDGGTPRQLTSGDFHHRGPLAWTADGSEVLFSANRRDDWDLEPADTEIYGAAVADGALRRLTERHGPDATPRVSPDGKRVAWIGFDERYQGYQTRRVSVMDLDGGNAREISTELDRAIADVQWSPDGKALIAMHDDTGNARLTRLSLDGEATLLQENVGGLSLGRPYTGGAFSVGGTGVVAYTLGGGDHPADLAVSRIDARQAPTRMTRVNDDLFSQRAPGRVESFWTESSHDGKRIQGWIVYPPDFDPNQTYPMILEIHGGPFATYSDFFAMELQLYAAAGYVVVYANPRGSTSYGEAFGNAIHHAYPGYDYDDLMSVVDAAVGRGFIDTDRLYVTGGSGGGVLTAWIVGKTDRFAAAVSAKPVINWTSFVLTADIPYVYRDWFPGLPWEHPEHYDARSPIHHVGNVVTPTMLLTGEADYRTPISESEQFYTALKLQQIDTALVRIPEASHGIAARPSHLIAKVLHILAWFDRYELKDGKSARRD